MIKVLHLVTTYQSVVTILNSKISRLSAYPDIDLYIASSFEDSSETRKPSCKFIRVDIARKINPFHDICSIWRLYWIIKKHGFDVVHTHTAKAGIVGAVAAFLARTPLVCHTYHGLPFCPGQNKLPYATYRFLEVIFSRFRHVLFSQNRRDFETLKQINGLSSKAIFEGNGVDVDVIEKNAITNLDKVDKYFNSRKLKLLCVARLEPVKRLEKLIEVVAGLKENRVDVECIIAGKGEEEERLLALVKTMELSDSISIVYTPYIHSLIYKSDIAVLTSEKEGLPRGLMESMALKKPVVATDVPGTNELVVNNETGFLGLLQEIAPFILKLAHDAALCKRFGLAGYRRILDHFDDRKIVDLWVEVYCKKLSKSSGIHSC